MRFGNRINSFAPVSPIVANTIVVPLVLFYGYGVNIPIPLQMLTVGLGEVLSCGVLGMILLFALEKYRGVIFKDTLHKEKNPIGPQQPMGFFFMLMNFSDSSQLPEHHCANL